MTMRAVGGNGGGKAVVACAVVVEDFAYGAAWLGSHSLASSAAGPVPPPDGGVLVRSLWAPPSAFGLYEIVPALRAGVLVGLTGAPRRPSGLDWAIPRPRKNR